MHWNHDLLLSAVYALYRRSRASAAARWLGEDALPKAGFRIKDPDAFILNDEGRPVRAIESAGSYGAAQVAGFHEHCARAGLGYELW